MSLLRAHLYFPVVDNHGDVLSDLQVRFYEPHTTTLISETVYALNSGNSELSQPITYSNGVIDAYLALPKRVTVGIEPQGQAEFFLHDQEFRAAGDNMLLSAGGVIVVQGVPSAADQAILSNGDGTARWGAVSTTGGGGSGYGGYGGSSLVISDETTELPLRDKLFIVGEGATATDDPTNEATVLTIPGAPDATGTDPATQPRWWWANNSTVVNLNPNSLTPKFFTKETSPYEDKVNGGVSWSTASGGGHFQVSQDGIWSFAFSLRATGLDEYDEIQMRAYELDFDANDWHVARWARPGVVAGAGSFYLKVAIPPTFMLAGDSAWVAVTHTGTATAPKMDHLSAAAIKLV